MIAIHFKEGDRLKLSNCRPITLLYTTCKIFCQCWLQPLLVEVIDCNQKTFLPFRLILDNILLTQETLRCAKESKQDVNFLKLDFSKTYDRVSHDFMFKVMTKISLLSIFVSMIRIMFVNVEASININNSAMKFFQFHGGVRQGSTDTSPISHFLGCP